MSMLYSLFKNLRVRNRLDDERSAGESEQPMLPITKEQANSANATPRTATFEENALLDYFMRNSGRVIHKWIDYFEVYDRSFSRFRGRPLKFVEIGVQNGGSARMWRDYFGPDATIIGVDIDPRCKALEAEGFEIWIGDQSDPMFWARFLEKHPVVDIVLDDGGHTMEQQIVTFKSLFEALNDGGIFLCEDTHSSYFPGYGGGLGKSGTFHEYVKQLIDEMHAWCHAPLKELADGANLAKHLYAISVYDSIVVLEKRRKNPPMALSRGQEGHHDVPVAMTYADLRRFAGMPEE